MKWVTLNLYVTASVFIRTSMVSVTELCRLRERADVGRLTQLKLGVVLSSGFELSLRTLVMRASRGLRFCALIRTMSKSNVLDNDCQYEQTGQVITLKLGGAKPACFVISIQPEVHPPSLPEVW